MNSHRLGRSIYSSSIIGGDGCLRQRIEKVVKQYWWTDGKTAETGGSGDVNMLPSWAYTHHDVFHGVSEGFASLDYTFSKHPKVILKK